jgi:hypothetical protein
LFCFSLRVWYSRYALPGKVNWMPIISPLYNLCLHACQNWLQFFFCLLASWQKAENHCKTLCGHLFSFKEEQDLKDVAQHFLKGEINMPYYWTGLRYAKDSWSFSDGEDTGYAISNLTDLRPGGNQSGRSRKCVRLEQNQTPLRPCTPMKWMCTTLHYFICQFHGNGCTSK